MTIDAKWEANELLTRLGLIIANVKNTEERIPLADLSIGDWVTMDHDTLKECFREFVLLLMTIESIELSMEDVDRIMSNNRFNAIINDNFSTEGN